MTEIPDLAKYYDMLSSHDWFYDYSDDHSVWKAGAAAKDRLLNIAALSEKHDKLFQQFKRYRESGGPVPRRPLLRVRRVRRSQ